MRPQGRYPRVLILGIDGLDAKLVARMACAGELPAFSRLQNMGRLCPLATINPPESPVAGSALATGCNPGKRGIFECIHRDPRNYVPHLSLHGSKLVFTKCKNRLCFASRGAGILADDVRSRSTDNGYTLAGDFPSRECKRPVLGRARRARRNRAFGKVHVLHYRH